jgi:undecaprenyl-diphosphatase
MTDALIIFFGSYLAYVLAVLLAAFALWHFRAALVAVVAAGIARLMVKPIVVLFVHRARPYIANPSIRNIIGPQTGEEYQSFPSGHALFFFALATVVYRHDKRWGWVFFAGATLMGIARVLGGIHWPTDILGGAALGILVGWLVDVIYARFCHKPQS